MGVSSGTFSFDTARRALTATQVISEDRTTYYTITDIQRAAGAAIEELLQALDALATLYQLAPVGEYKAAIQFGDSVFEDTQSEFDRLKAMVEMGMRPQKLLAWYFNVDEETAKGYLTDLHTDDTNAGTPHRDNLYKTCMEGFMDILELLEEFGAQLPRENQDAFLKRFRKSYKHENEVNALKKKLQTAQQALENGEGENLARMQEELLRLEEENGALHAQNEQLARDYALKQALKAAQVRSQKAVLALLDMPLIRLEEGKLTGLDEQLKRIKEECPYLFEAPRGQYPRFAP